MTLKGHVDRHIDNVPFLMLSVVIFSGGGGISALEAAPLSVCQM